MNIIIRGPLGIGKTTIAKEVAKNLNAKYLSVDKLLEENNLDKVDKKIGKVPLNNFLKVNKIISRLKGDLVIDGNFYYKKQIEDLIKKIGKIKVFTLKASLNECIRRDKSRKNQLGKKAAREVFNLVSKFDYGKIVDTENKTSEEVVKLILKELT